MRPDKVNVVTRSAKLLPADVPSSAWYADERVVNGDSVDDVSKLVSVCSARSGTIDSV